MGERLDKIAKEKRLPTKPRIFDVNSPLPFPDAILMRYIVLLYEI